MESIRRLINIAIVLVVSCIAWASTAAQDEPVDFEKVTSSIRDLGEKPAPPEQTNSADDIGRILNERPAVPATPSQFGKPRAARAVLPQEGSRVINRRCTLSADAKSGWSVLKFVDSATPGDTQRLAMPCHYLQALEDFAAKTPGTVFVVSGETFVCNRQAYLLLDKVLIEPPPASAPAVTPAAAIPATEPKSDPAASASAPAAASAPATGKAQPRSPKRSDAIVSGMLAPPRRPVLLPVDEPRKVAPPSVAPGKFRELLGEESSFISDRVVSIVQESGTGWYLACFDSDNTLQEPPCRILPCELLEKASKAAASSDTDYLKASPTDLAPRLGKRIGVKEKNVAVPLATRYRISGEIKLYNGQKYLVLRKRLPERDMGQL